MVNGHDIVEGEALVRRSIGLVGSEERSFYWRLTGRQNLEFFCALHNLYGRRMHERIEEILELLGLSAVADRMFQTYSTGMKQKMCIARGLLTDPTILFLDEPTRSLDPIAAESIRCFIKETLVRRQGRTVVLTTHRLEEAAQVCDRIAIMDKGRIKGCGSLSELRTILGSSCRYQLDTTEIPQGVAESLHRIGGVENLEMRERRILFSSPWAQNALPDVITALVKGGVSILNCRVDEITLDEIFSCLVSEEGAPEYASQALGIS
jgi:ABC-2 type transport system ATP-binding protein